MSFSLASEVFGVYFSQLITFLKVQSQFCAHNYQFTTSELEVAFCVHFQWSPLF